MGIRMPFLKTDGVASRLTMALKIMLSQILIEGPAWSKWRGESRSGPALLPFLRSLMAALTSSGANDVSRMVSSPE